MLTIVAKKQFKNLVEQVLHTPGNYRGGILEMAMVFDACLPPKVLQQLSAEITGILKGHSEVFRNVRLNTIHWQSDQTLVKEVTPLPYLQMGRYFDGCVQVLEQKRLESLAAQLKLYYARSKLILIFTDGSFVIGNENALREALQPFLGRKLIYITYQQHDGAESIQILRRIEKRQT